MVMAASLNTIDFKEAALLDRRWWTKLRWTLNRLEENLTADIFRLQHTQHSSIMSYDMPKEAFEHHWSGANDSLRSLFDIYFPWAATQDKDPSNKYKSLMDQWKQKFGDMRDPKVRQKFDKIAKAWHADIERKKNAVPKTDPNEEKLRRVIANRKRRTKRKR